jgi:hypothetical protein
MRKIIITEEQLRLLKESGDWELEQLPPEYKSMVVKCLGEGGYGKAYLLNNNTVLKITTDSLEYSLAEKMKGFKLNHIANVYDTFKIPETRYKVIVMEYLEMANDELKNLFTKLVLFIKNEILGNRDGNFFGYHLTDEVREKTYYSLNNGFPFSTTEQNRMIMADIFVQLCEAIDEIKQFRANDPNGHICDIHSGNFGFDKQGVLKMFDQV